jgi:ribosome-associated translation inhibitor RaiA
MPRTSSTDDGTKSTEPRKGGRAALAGPPVALHSRTSLPPRLATEIRNRVSDKVKASGAVVERSAVRFDDVGSEVRARQTACQIEVIITGHPAVHAEARGPDASEAFRHALIKLAKGLIRTVGKHAASGNGNGNGSESAAALAPEISPDHRSVHRKPSRATAALEESETRPSRKSTRGSANRGKPGQSKERTALARSLTPKAKASRANARGKR